MMSLRRWLTSKYDWTGLSSLLYRSFPATIAALILVLAGTLFFACSRDFNLEEMLHYGHRFEIIAISTVFLVIFVPQPAAYVVLHYCKTKSKNTSETVLFNIR